jgi:hypothetical protein
MKQQGRRSAGQARKIVDRAIGKAEIPFNRMMPIGSRDFGRVESSNEAITIIGNIAAQAGKSAASEIKALRMSRVYAQSARIILETPDGQKNIVATARQLPQKKYFKKYTPGTVLHAVKK